MLKVVKELLAKNQIELISNISLSDCRVTRGYLLSRAGIEKGTVFIFAVPYLSRVAQDGNRNISAYAAPPDYHGFFASLFENILPSLKASFPHNKFVGFSDHSPIDERLAAASAGLGIIGDNGMIITEKYSSYVFLGEIITDAVVECTAREPLRCEGCGACRLACPYSLSGDCLSALTQKKGCLTPEEEATVLKHGCAWGCDICQEVCPHTKRAVKNGTVITPIPYFSENVIPHLSVDLISEMTDADFALRAYSWRGRETIMRNLKLLQSAQEFHTESATENEKGRKES